MSEYLCKSCRLPRGSCVCAEIAEEISKARSSDDQRARRVISLRGPDEPQRLVPCRDCGDPVELSEFAWLMAQKASDMLAKRGEEPLRDEELTRCTECGKKWRAKERGIADADQRTVQAVIREAKAKGHLPESEAAWLKKHGHGDTVAALRQRFDRQTSAKPRRSGKARQERVE